MPHGPRFVVYSPLHPLPRYGTQTPITLGSTTTIGRTRVVNLGRPHGVREPLESLQEIPIPADSSHIDVLRVRDPPHISSVLGMLVGSGTVSRGQTVGVFRSLPVPRHDSVTCVGVSTSTVRLPRAESSPLGNSVVTTPASQFRLLFRWRYGTHREYSTPWYPSTGSVRLGVKGALYFCLCHRRLSCPVIPLLYSPESLYNRQCRNR